MGKQLRRAFAVCKKDIRIYYFKGPVLIFGVLIPIFLFLSFSVGRNVPSDFLVPGLLGMTLFFTATSVVPVIAPWEARNKTLERLVSAPISITAIIVGDVLASFIFGVVISIVPITVGLLMGVRVFCPATLILGILLASFCFSSMAAILSTPPTDMTANIMIVSTIVKFPLVFISGIFIPLEEMPGWGRLIALCSPLTFFTDLARCSFQNFSQYPVFLDLAVLAAFAVVFLAVAVKLHQRNIPKRI